MRQQLNDAIIRAQAEYLQKKIEKYEIIDSTFLNTRIVDGQVDIKIIKKR